MTWWVILLIVLVGVAGMALLVRVTERVASVARDISDDGDDTAPGWILRCTRCQSWRPATEAGVVRMGAASRKKYTLSRCSTCGGLAMVAVEKGPGPAGRRRIDDNTNETIWPETIGEARAGSP